MAVRQPRLLVFSTLFPHSEQPNAGIFIRERMFRVGRRLPLVVVAPVPWFPFDGLIRRFRPHFRPTAPRYEVQKDIEVHYPRFLSLPGIGKWLDGAFLALGSLTTLWRLKQRFRFQLIDAHFAYPDGYAASLLGRWFQVPVTITLRGTEVRMARTRLRRRQMLAALRRADRIFSVSNSLKELAVRLGIPEAKIRVIGNGVDTDKFSPLPRDEARRMLALPVDAPVLISVGALVERKGFHRVIELLPELRRKFPGLQYLVVGGPSTEGNWGERLRDQVKELGLTDSVRFLGVLPADRLRVPLSAADVFVLSTRNEGWANVFLEAMACGLPVVTTDVGGNQEVVARSDLGLIVPFNDRDALCKALQDALRRAWDRQGILAYARENSWNGRIETLVNEFARLGLCAE